MNKTPRTNERTYPADCLGKTLVVNAEWAQELERENAALRAALTPWLAWEDTGGDIPPSAARELFRIARAAIDAAQKEQP